MPHGLGLNRVYVNVGVLILSIFDRKFAGFRVLLVISSKNLYFCLILLYLKQRLHIPRYRNIDFIFGAQNVKITPANQGVRFLFPILSQPVHSSP